MPFLQESALAQVPELASAQLLPPELLQAGWIRPERGQRKPFPTTPRAGFRPAAVAADSAACRARVLRLAEPAVRDADVAPGRTGSPPGHPRSENDLSGPSSA